MKKSEKVQLLEEVQEKMKISSEFANQQKVEAAVMQAWENQMKTRRKNLNSKGTSKTEKEWKYWRYEIRTSKKGESDSKYAWSRHASLKKSFRKKRWACLNQAFITEKRSMIEIFI